MWIRPKEKVQKKSKEIIDDYIEIPSQLYARNNRIILCIDIMYINSCIFLEVLTNQ